MITITSNWIVCSRTESEKTRNIFGPMTPLDAKRESITQMSVSRRWQHIGISYQDCTFLLFLIFSTHTRSMNLEHAECREWEQLSQVHRAHCNVNKFNRLFLVFVDFVSCEFVWTAQRRHSVFEFQFQFHSICYEVSYASEPMWLQFITWVNRPPLINRVLSTERWWWMWSSYHVFDFDNLISLISICNARSAYPAHGTNAISIDC